ncbi:hypothetical protein [Salibaculum griseiflavum]|uniref:Uncharacterized protein n=1 Tax=Salibaculum griseiflavum TaxID=1914409 RepID=A0A2V1P1W6_9RHOB|nr:hypothetical protein [Salibaculum griseiflavum]PWG15834.1 hypothetical protein DFK10_14985 [Salibaculum griseiflavum]
MGTTQTEYEKRLPYAWAWDEKTRTEYLLHRGYHAIARRPAEEPMAAEYLPGVEHPEHDYKGFFYDDGNSPCANAETKAQCERILTLFLAGHDVRQFIRKSGLPATDAAYTEKAFRDESDLSVTRGPHGDEALRQRLKRVAATEAHPG